ncbi:MAG: alpha/beta fold hydrolase [Intrasporangium sp.]|uniref:alpha/beta fold hydrolase n=1 Tax=Intrasporangium sp. TaxID=1925024 RepID=UPI003F7F0B00
MISAEYTIPGLHVREHEVAVPLDWDAPETSAEITVFARELVDPTRRHEDLPVLVYLQGGPGGKGPRPTDASGWVGHALKTHRVLLLDQRGTGRSTRVDGRTMARFEDDGAAAAYLSCFRADSIVKDAEHLRTRVFRAPRWSTLGQSFGGFITLTYLSQAPEGLAACYITGGLPSIRPDAEEVYRRTYARVETKNLEYFARYPHDRERMDRLADRLSVADVLLPDGDVLTVRRFQSLGIDLGMKPGAERLHWLLEEALDADGEVTDTFLGQVLGLSSFADNPLFAALHEPIYGHGAGTATAWAAQRVRDKLPEFAEDARPVLFTGEMIFPWMFEEIRLLRPFAGAAEVLSARTEWSPLYDPDRLARNDVPVAAAVYYDDMYVDAGLSLETAAAVGNVRAWVTNEYEHDGLRLGDVFPRLRTMIDEMGGGKNGE